MTTTTRDLDAPLRPLAIFSNHSWGHRKDYGTPPPARLKARRKLLAQEIRKGRKLNGSKITRQQYRVWRKFYTAHKVLTGKEIIELFDRCDRARSQSPCVHGKPIDPQSGTPPYNHRPGYCSICNLGH